MAYVQSSHEAVAGIIGTQFGKKIKLVDPERYKVRGVTDPAVDREKGETSFFMTLATGERLQITVKAL